MKKITLKSLVSTMALAALILTPASLSAQNRASLEGAWDSQVTNTDCNGNILMEFRSFEAFHQGGTFTGMGNTPNLGLGSAVVLGTWQRTPGMRTFNSTFQFFTFNPDGSFAGTVKIDGQIHLAVGGNSYTSTSTFGVYDPDGNLVFSGCGTEVATRLP